MNKIFDWLYIRLLKQIRPYDKQGAQLWQKRRQIRNEILAYYKEHPTNDIATNEAIDYLSKRVDMVYFPAQFREKYEYCQIDLGFDAENTPYWEMEPGHKLYFMPGEPDKVRMSINCLRIEQDKLSPHRYVTNDYCPNENDILADVGSAEGYLSLQYVDRVKKVYLFESDSAWVKILEKTFAPWKDKVKIVSKYVSDTDDNQNIRLDTFFQAEGIFPTFIKIDVEGAEPNVLRGMKGLFNTGKEMRITACTYHTSDEYQIVTKQLKEMGFSYETSNGFMLFNLYDECKPPYFRHGLVRFTTHK